MKGTIADWERDRFEREASAELSGIATTNEPVVIVEREAETVELLGRSFSGLSVELLFAPTDGRTFVKVAIADREQTLEIPRDKAYDAFQHPFAYGCTLQV
jgi:hypothetical protein